MRRVDNLDFQREPSASHNRSTRMAHPGLAGARLPSTAFPAKCRATASWKFPTAIGVNIEVALWPHTIKLQNGLEIEVLNATIIRSYRDQQGQWKEGGSFRIAEFPVLLHALVKAHAFAINHREMTTPF